jgi:hypothetical protein
MPLHFKIVLKTNLSQETLNSIRGYLRQFLDRRHTLEHFNGGFSIYLHDAADARLVREQFSLLIMDVQDVR